MNRTTAPNSVSGAYVDDDPETGTTGTLLIATDRNAVQEEIVGVIEGAGITPNVANNGQLLEALQKGAGSSFNADLLDGQHGSYYRDASNLNAGTIQEARLPASALIDCKDFGPGNNADPGDAVVSDADTAFTVGFYRLAAGANGNPFSNDCILKVYRNGGGELQQEAVDPTIAVSFTGFKYRNYISSSWGAWTGLVNQDLKTTDSPTFSKIYSPSGAKVSNGPRRYHGGLGMASGTLNASYITGQQSNVTVAPGKCVAHFNSGSTIQLHTLSYAANVLNVSTVGAGLNIGVASYITLFAPTWDGNNEARCLLLDRDDGSIKELKIVLSTGAITAENSVSMTFNGSNRGACNLYRHNQSVTNNVDFAYLENGTGGLRCIRWNGSTVEQVGNAYTTFGTVGDFNIELDYLKDGYICMTYRQGSSTRYASVMKFDGTDWTEIYSFSLGSNVQAAIKALTDEWFVSVHSGDVADLHYLALDDSTSSQSSIGISPAAGSSLAIRVATGAGSVSTGGATNGIRITTSSPSFGGDNSIGEDFYRGIYHANYPW